MIEILISRLAPSGMLIVEEVYYDSYVVPRLTSFMIFYALKILNNLRIDLSRLIRDIKPGLEVNFLCESQLFNILNHYGHAYRVSKTPWTMPKYYKVLLLRSYGFITHILVDH
jgi:hypothetical protein